MATSPRLKTRMIIETKPEVHPVISYVCRYVMELASLCGQAKTEIIIAGAPNGIMRVDLRRV